MFKEKKVLVISHNPFSDTRNNGKTLSSFFEKWLPQNLANLYLTPDIPDFTVCKNYFQITDLEILKANILFKKAHGKIYSSAELKNFTPKHNGRLYNLVKWFFVKRNPFAEFFRELCWKKSKYQSENLLKWLDDFSPEAIFFQGSNMPFAYKMVEWICDKYNCPLLLQLTDDYTFIKSRISPFAWINHLMYMKEFKKGLKRAKSVYVISPAMKIEYEERFRCNHIFIAANSVEPIEIGANKTTNFLRLIYTGSVSLERWRVLKFLGECLKELREEGFAAILDVYTPLAIDDRLKSQLTIPNIMSYKGCLDYSGLIHERTHSDVFVHIESFLKFQRKITRLSLSTKIPEYMVSGRCILAIGPHEISSISYLKNNDLAVVVTEESKDELKKAVRESLFDATKRDSLATKARQFAMENHNKNAIQKIIYNHMHGSTNDEKNIQNEFPVF